MPTTVCEVLINTLHFNKVELDHWANGPNHVWTYPESGQILRTWNPFKGLSIYTSGVHREPIDLNDFQSIPPKKCKKGGATLRTGCDENGYPSKK